MYPPSPCIGLCRLDEATGLCVGCARTAQEIALWRDAGQSARDEVWARLPARRARLGIGMFRLGWTRADIQSFVRRSLEERSGTWTAGVPGAIAEFSIEDGRSAVIEADAETITACAAGGALRFTIGDGVRALAIAEGGEPETIRAILLATARERLSLPVHAGLAALGGDRLAVDPGSRSHALFDLGLGRTVAQFCIRTRVPQEARRGGRDRLAGLPAGLRRGDPAAIAASGGPDRHRPHRGAWPDSAARRQLAARPAYAFPAGDPGGRDGASARPGAAGRVRTCRRLLSPPDRLVAAEAMTGFGFYS